MIRFFVLAYGEEFVNLYEKIALRSLLQSENRINDAIVSIYSDGASLNRLADLSQPLGLVEGTVIVPQSDSNDTQREAFIREIKLCVEQKSTMVVVSPDNFWGNGSLRNGLNILAHQNACLAIPHIRVDQAKFLEALPTGEVSNDQLMKLSMETIHGSWLAADATQEKTNSYFTGISIARITENLFAVTHLQPTCFICNFTAEDYEFFVMHPTGRALFDQYWPSELVKSGRYRVIGSSDAAFIAELTPSDSHHTNLTMRDPRNHSRFVETKFHTEANRNVVSIWRI